MAGGSCSCRTRRLDRRDIWAELVLAVQMVVWNSDLMAASTAGEMHALSQAAKPQDFALTRVRAATSVAFEVCELHDLRSCACPSEQLFGLPFRDAAL